ncbi:MAG: hypothetical protein JO099_14690 [Acidobacteriia bacterium]|nr:hypothetical protein [Terriglobia bacterium]
MPYAKNIEGSIPAVAEIKTATMAAFVLTLVAWVFVYTFVPDAPLTPEDQHLLSRFGGL